MHPHQTIADAGGYIGALATGRPIYRPPSRMPAGLDPVHGWAPGAQAKQGASLLTGYHGDVWRDQHTGALIAQPSQWQKADMGRNPSRYALVGPPPPAPGYPRPPVAPQAPDPYAGLEAALLAAGYPRNYDGPAQLDDGSWVWVSP